MELHSQQGIGNLALNDVDDDVDIADDHRLGRSGKHKIEN